MKVRLQFVAGPALAIALVGTPVAAGVRGQRAICGTAPQARTVELTASEKTLDIGEGLRTERWTFDGRSPGPTIEACEGDTVKIVVRNEGKMARGRFKVRTGTGGQDAHVRKEGRDPRGVHVPLPHLNLPRRIRSTCQFSFRGSTCSAMKK